MPQQQCEKCEVKKYAVLLNKVVLHDRSNDNRKITTVCDNCLEEYSKDENFEWWSNH